jgi:ribosomal-protein-alanine N-acetyltransferase
MAFLRASTSFESPIISAQGVFLRVPSLADYPEWAQLRSESRTFLTPWEPTWPADDLTRAAFRRRIRRYQSEMRDDHSYAFFIFSQPDSVLVGGVTLSNVTRGMTQTGTVGYWMGERYANRGMMTRAVRALVPFAFNALRLHRLEAACLPHNRASMRLLEKVGFRREGLARGLVCINGPVAGPYRLRRCCPTIRCRNRTFLPVHSLSTADGQVRIPSPCDRRRRALLLCWQIGRGGCALRAEHTLKRILLAVMAVMLAAKLLPSKPFPCPSKPKTLDLGGAIERYFNQAERIQVSTARGPTGIVRRIEVRSENAGGTSDWVVFALANPSDEQIERHARRAALPAGRLGLIWPISVRSAFAPSPQRGHRAGNGSPATNQTSSASRSIPARSSPTWPNSGHPDLPEIHLWQPEAYEDVVNSYTLYRGRRVGYRRASGAVPERAVRRQGHRHVPGDRGARLGGARLHLHRLRLLEQGFSDHGRQHGDIARGDGSRARRRLARLPLHVPASAPLARTLQSRWGALAARARCSGWRYRH